MNEPAARIANLLRHQAAIAGFGSFALRETNLNTILTEAARVCAEGLGASFSKVCRYRDAHHDLIIEAGWGWNQGVIGTVVSATPSSPQGQAFVTRKPSIHNDLPGDKDFSLPPFYVEHGIISIADVVINAKDAERPYGVLEIDSEVPREYDQHDIDFLTGFANVLAEAVATSVRTTVLCTTLDQMKTLVSSLAKSEERLRVVVEAAPNAIILTGADGRIEMVNAEAEHAFGYTRSELIGNHADMLVPSRFRGSNSPVLSATPVQLTGVGRGLFGVRKNGEEFQVEIGFTPIETDEGR
jgi:PAS domain S-box-containing protein